jgi:hypothetical protein
MDYSVNDQIKEIKKALKSCRYISINECASCVLCVETRAGTRVILDNETEDCMAVHNLNYGIRTAKKSEILSTFYDLNPTLRPNPLSLFIEGAKRGCE